MHTFLLPHRPVAPQMEMSHLTRTTLPNIKVTRYKGKRQYPNIPNHPSEASAHFMFELAKTVNLDKNRHTFFFFFGLHSFTIGAEQGRRKQRDVTIHAAAGGQPEPLWAPQSTAHVRLSDRPLRTRAAQQGEPQLAPQDLLLARVLDHR